MLFRSADFCLLMLLQARDKGVRRLVVADGMRLPFAEGTFDAITIAFGLRNMESWPDALREMGRVLKTNGHLLVLDFSIPENQRLAGAYRYYLRNIMPRVAGWVTGEKSAYDYLAESIEKFPRGNAMVSLMNGNGFCDAACLPLTFGAVSLYIAGKSEK